MPTIVEQVARELNLKADPADERRWYVRTAYNSSFTLSARKDDKGYWVIGLMDWPTVARSAESKLSEEKIRAALKRPNQSPQHNAGVGPATLDSAIPSHRALSSEETVRAQPPRG